MLLSALSLASLALPADPVAPAEWGRFRGPDGTGLSTAKNLPEALDPEGTLVWRTEIPKGFSSPVIAGDLLFVTGADDDGPATFCLDVANGEVLWREAAPGGMDDPYGGPNARVSSTPATDGEPMYCYFRHFGLVGYDLEGEQVWEYPIEPLYVPHGASTSPVLCEGLLLLQCDQDRGSYLLALDLETGKERWRADRPGMPHSYSTPSVYRPAEGPPQVVLSGSFQTSAYSVKDGKQLWRAEGMCWMPEAMPAVGEGLAFVSSYILNPTEFGRRVMIATITDPDPIHHRLPNRRASRTWPSPRAEGRAPAPHRADATALRSVRAVLNPPASGLEAPLTEPRAGGALASTSQRSPRALREPQDRTRPDSSGRPTGPFRLSPAQCLRTGYRGDAA